MNDLNKLVSAEEAAELVALKPQTLRRLAWQQKIRSFKVLGRLRFRVADLEALVVERPSKGHANAQAHLQE
jgi:excisionase family DNA binding protein